jgi:hypothetical protein
MKPIMSENSDATPGIKRWAWVWIASTTLIPGVLGWMCFWREGSNLAAAFFMLFNLAFHVQSCTVIGEGKPAWLKVFLVTGGLLLMMASFFFGCASGIRYR